MTRGFATLAKVAFAIVIGAAVAVHFLAPDLMKTLGQVIHGGR